MKPRWSSRQRWWLLAAGWLGLLVLGIGGFIQQSDELDLGTDFLDHLYFTLQLAALDYKGASQAINWRLQVVRFAAPLMSATTLAQSASVVFRDQLTRWRASRARGHTVLCGLDPVGSGLLESLVDAGRSVVAIDGSPTSPGVAVAARLGVPVIVGDPTDQTVLLAARTDRADRVVAITANDAVNVAITSAVRDIDRPGGRPPLRCSVRLSDGGIAHLLRSTELGGRDDVKVSYFNVHERAAQALFGAHPLVGDDEQPESVHVMVAGLGQFGCNLVVGAAQRWMEHGRGPLPMTLIDRRASGRLRALTMQHPALASSLDATCIDLDLEAPSPGALAEFDSVVADRPPSLVIVAFENDALAWTSSLFIRRRVPGSVDIVVRTDSDGGFGHHLQSNVERSATIGRIVSFPFVSAACSVELIEGGVREQLAQSIHNDHVAHAGTGAQLHRGWNRTRRPRPRVESGCRRRARRATGCDRCRVGSAAAMDGRR